MAKKITKTQLSKQQKEFVAVLKKMPKITSRSTDAQINKLYEWCEYEFDALRKSNNRLADILRGYLFQIEYDKQGFMQYRKASRSTLSARGWHKDHYNYNKAEKHELPPSLRRTPARNVTKTGAKRKRATTIKKYKR